MAVGIQLPPTTYNHSLSDSDFQWFTSFRRQDYFDNAHPLFSGYLGLGIDQKLADRVQDADLLLVLGARLGEVSTSGYSLLNIPNPNQKLIHVHADPEELGRVYQAQLPINADPSAMAAVLEQVPTLDASRWSKWVQSANDDFRAHNLPTVTAGDLQMGEVMAYLCETLPQDAILTNGAGNYTVWVHRFYRYRQVWNTTRADRRLNGIRRACCNCRKAAVPRTGGCRFCG